ncbi:MAG: hypothetical protein GY768_00515 [Planctomycetaceae bacterium]|nr:hypothetical protein [Planctomycetaceae bacterium]
MKIVFHGPNALTFREGLEPLLDDIHDMVEVPDALSTDRHIAAYAGAEVIVGVVFDETMPSPDNLKLFQVPGAGVDGILRSALPYMR